MLEDAKPKSTFGLSFSPEQPVPETLPRSYKAQLVHFGGRLEPYFNFNSPMTGQENRYMLQVGQNIVVQNINELFRNVSGTLPIPHEQEKRREQLWNAVAGRMEEGIQTLTREVAALKSEIQRLKGLRSYVVTLTSLAPLPIQMINQIPVTIEGDGEDFTASFVEGNISASGETEADAIANFKESLLSTYEVLEGLTPQQRGPLPTRQWEILQNVVRRAD
jgi:hypothetical protein